MRPILAIAAGTAILLLVLSQLLLPGFVDGRVEGRLTKDGGSADVTLKAFPALTLLAHSGSEAKVRGSGLSLDLTIAGDRPLHELDGFGKVDIKLSDSNAGPFSVGRLVLRRPSRGDPYEILLDATVTGREVGAYAGRTLAGPFGDFLGGLAAGAVPYADATIPVHVDAAMNSQDGRPRVASATGTVAGLPAGPLVEALAVAVAQRF